MAELCESSTHSVTAYTLLQYNTMMVLSQANSLNVHSPPSSPAWTLSVPPRHLTDDLDSDAAPPSLLTLTFMHSDTHYDRENMFY